MEILTDINQINDFNPRSREGSDIFRLQVTPIRLLFQSTLPRGERHKGKMYTVIFEGFQSTLPRGERPGQLRTVLFCAYFNPRSREGSDLNANFYEKDGQISIHAPARGATLISRIFLLFVMYFNPRSREGSDVVSNVDLNWDLISIHAPARGATRSWFFRLRYRKFQSTLPRGERQFYSNADMAMIAISIHAPARGATQLSVQGQKKLIISIHAPARGATKSAAC